MRIQILQADKTELGLVVRFETQIGIGKGIWNGTSPQLQTIYEVEFEVRESLVWGKTIFKTQEMAHKLSFVENSLLYLGRG